MLNLSSGVCFGPLCPTTLDLEKVGPGSFKIINIDGSQGGTGSQTLADWIAGGLNQSMPLGWYYSDTGAKVQLVERTERDGQPPQLRVALPHL